MKIFNKLIIAITLVSFVLTGCSSRPINFNELNQNKPDLSKVDFQNGRDVIVSSGGLQLLLFIPIAVNSRQYRAYRQLKEQVGNNYIADIQVQESWTYAFVGTVYTTKLKARVYPYKN